MITLKIGKPDGMIRNINSKVKELNALPLKAYTFFKSHTPIKSGRARRSTRLNGDTIQAQYPYAERLDNGWSNQAPDGMSKPTEAFIQKTADRIIKRK